MGEVTVKEGKIMMAIDAQNLRQLVSIANELSIQREDIVSLVKESGQYILIYYGDGRGE